MKDKRSEEVQDPMLDGVDKSTKPNNAILWIFVGLFVVFVLAVIGLAIAIAVVRPSSGNDLSVFISIFSILITMIAVIVPISSYMLNRKDFEKAERNVRQELYKNKKDVEQIIDKSKGEIAEIGANVQSKITEHRALFDSRYSDLAESIVNDYTVHASDSDDTETKVNIGYINASLYYDRGDYFGCKQKLQKGILDDLNELYKKCFCDSNTETKPHDERLALLTYKIFNLYRHVAGRTRDFGGIFIDLLKAKNSLEKQPDGAQSKTCIVLYYTLARTKMDEIEKAANTSKINDAKSIAVFVGEINELSEKIASAANNTFGKKLSASIRARAYQMAARYSSNRNSGDADASGENTRKKGERKKERYRNDSERNAVEASEFLKSTECEAIEYADSEIDKVLISGCRFSVAKTLEKLSYDFDKDRAPKLLQTAKELIDTLIKSKRDPKYYLELSEIYKKLGQLDNAEYAAQYGYQLAPCDPMLAAQCAHLYLRKYLKGNKGNSYYLYKAEEYIKNAYWIYSQEKGTYGDNNVNIKFLYIPSLFVVIKSLICADQKDKDCNFAVVLDAADENSIKYYVDESIAVGKNAVVANSVPNFLRALLSYYELFKIVDSGELKGKYMQEMFLICEQYWKNPTLWFGSESEFYDDTGTIIDFIVNCYRAFKPNSILSIEMSDNGGHYKYIEKYIENETGAKMKVREFIDELFKQLQIKEIHDAFFGSLNKNEYIEKFIADIEKLIDKNNGYSKAV